MQRYELIIQCRLPNQAMTFSTHLITELEMMMLRTEDIDPKVRSLVELMNHMGFRTHASCQGHGFPVNRLKPYVAFRCDIRRAAALETLLRQDAESMKPALMWGWQVTASFDENINLIFILKTNNPHTAHYRWMRSSIDQDLTTLSKFVIKSGELCEDTGKSSCRAKIDK